MIILHAGNARSSAFEAIAAAKRSDEALVQAKLEEAETSFLEAHKLQTELAELEDCERLSKHSDDVRTFVLKLRW